MPASELKMEDMSAILNTAELETPFPPSELSSQTLVNAFRTMQLSRRIDDREVLLKRQNKIFFQISGAGHEAVQVAAGLLLRPGQDWVYPYYRDRALCLTLGMSPEEMFLQAFGAASDPSSGGRQMPSHWSYPKLNIVAGSSPTGTQYVQSIGCAEGVLFQNPESDSVVLVCSGEGATSEGEFWEALSAACANRLPVIFLIEDNGYAISVPSEKQTPGGNISALLTGFPICFALNSMGLTSSSPTGPVRKPSPIAGSITAPLSSTRTWYDLIHIRFPTMSAPTRRRSNATWKPSATRSENTRDGWSSMAISIGTALKH